MDNESTRVSNVRFLGVKTELMWHQPFHRFGKSGSRWYTMVLVGLDELIDAKAVYIPERFCLIACSPEYLARPNKVGPPLDSNFTVIQNSFDMNELEEIAKKKYSSIHASSFTELWSKMGQEFHVDEIL